MGREAEGHLRLGSRQGAGRLHLDSAALTLRGEVRAVLPRAALTEVRTEGEDLVLSSPEGPLRATLGEKEAAAFARAILKPPPSLAEKLGLDRPVRAVTAIHDPELRAAVDAAPEGPPAQALAEVGSEAALAAALRAAGDLPLWVCLVKGKASPYGDTPARAFLRAAGWVDVKSCAVSETLTGTRWLIRGSS